MSKNTMTPEQQERYNEWVKALGKVFAEERKNQGLTQNKMAMKIGVDMKYYQDAEYGNRNLTTRTLFLFADGMGVELRDLVNRVGNTQGVSHEKA